MEPVVYLALDPGDSTGWATFDLGGSLVKQGTSRNYDGREGLYKLLQEWHATCPDLTTVICEDYFLYPWKGKAQSWSPLETTRVIGVIEYWCFLTGRKLVLQPANIKSIGYKYAGMKETTNKIASHAENAYIHGVFFLQKYGIRKPQQGRK
jgi:hypothetical protein